MVAITTTATTDPVDYPGQSYLDRDPVTGYLWMVVIKPSNIFELYRSIDDGVNWTMAISLTRASVQEISSIVIDNSGMLNWAYRTNESSQDRIYYRRINLSAGTLAWDAEVLTGNPANGGVAGAVHTGIDIQSVGNLNSRYVCIAVGTVLGTSIGVTLYGVISSPSTAAAVYNNGILKGTRQWLNTAPTGRVTPSLEIEHTGNPKVSTNGALWVTWGRTTVVRVRIPFVGGGWQGPSTAQTVVGGITAQDFIAARWNGTYHNTAIPNPVSTSTVRVYRRNQANTETTTITSPTHPTGIVRNCSLSHNHSTGDLRIYAIGTSTTVLYYVDWVQATNTWTSWNQVSATAVIGATGQNYGIRRGSTGNSKFDIYFASGSTPFTINHLQQSLSFAPNAPTWAAMAYNHGSAADVNAALTLDWIFSDIVPTDVQSAYALSRQIGTGALQYWRASDSTWQSTEIKNLTSTTQLTLGSGWAAASDAAYTFAVKVWDSTDIPSLYSAPFTLIPSSKVNPTITSPTEAQVINGTVLTTTWTASEQTAFRVELQIFTSIVEDTGWVSSTDLQYTLTSQLADGFSYSLFITTKNNEGLSSNRVQVNFSVDYTEPPVGSYIITPLPSSGVMQIVITNPTPVGAQPNLTSYDIYRRKTGSAIINSNPYFETNTTDWTGVTVGSFTRSSTQFHQGGWSARLVPNGTDSFPRIESGFYTIDSAKRYTIQAWGRPDTANKPLQIFIDWYTSGSVFISRSSVNITSVAGAWLFNMLGFTPPSNATKVKVGVGILNTPAAGDAAYFDEIVFREETNEGNGVLIASGLDATSVTTTYYDWRAISGVDYEYRTLSKGSNGTALYGPWTA